MTTPRVCFCLATVALVFAMPFRAACSTDPLPPKKLLVVSVTTGYRHASIPTAERVLSNLAARSGRFTVDFVENPPGMPTIPPPPFPGPGPDNAAYEEARARWLTTVPAALTPLSPANLARYDGVVFLSTTGDLPLPDRDGFVEWVRQGHAFIGVHAAADTFHDYPAYIAMLGAEFMHHGAQVSVDCLNQDPAHAATSGLQASWTVFDEIYLFKNFDEASVHMLLALDRHPNDKTPGFYPVSWCKPFGTGRVFYTSLGHREDVWDPNFSVRRKNAPEVATAFQQHLLGGILWALQLAPGQDYSSPSK